MDAEGAGNPGEELAEKTSESGRGWGALNDDLLDFESVNNTQHKRQGEGRMVVKGGP